MTHYIVFLLMTVLGQQIIGQILIAIQILVTIVIHQQLV